jgi:hypothetical protein
LDRDPPARLTKIFDPPIHHCDVTRYILLVQANESTILKKGIEENVTKGVRVKSLPVILALISAANLKPCARDACE